ncbi:MAG: hypothetical protein ACRD4Y_01445 [Candidatus Acidiferrales bacterium]
MSIANPRWGAPRIHGELLKLGIQVTEATVAKYMVRHRKPPSQTWRTFLRNDTNNLVAVDFFVVPTISFRLLFVFVILAHDPRRPIHFAVTANPTAEWTARQLLEALPWDSAPRYLLRDRDGIYGLRVDADQNTSTVFWCPKNGVQDYCPDFQSVFTVRYSAQMEFLVGTGHVKAPVRGDPV